MKHMPTLFVGHGSPMMALEHTETTNIFQSIHTKIYKNGLYLWYKPFLRVYYFSR